MSRHGVPKEKQNDIASFSEGTEDVQGSSIFGQYSIQEMITQLKGLAVGPCMPQHSKDNIQPLWNQILRLRKFMIREDSDMPWRKRKLEQLVKDGMRAPSGFVTPNQPSKTKRSRREQLSQPSSISCLLNSTDSVQSHDHKSISASLTSSSLVTFDEALPQKEVTTQSSFADGVVDVIPSVVDSDESVNGSNPSSPVGSPLNEARRIGISRVVDKPSERLLFIEGDLDRKAIPFGPRFQADIPELVNAYVSDSSNLKWLGSQIWPIETGNVKPSNKRIGKGRPNSCSCISRGSADCVKFHIRDERLQLQRELGPAFSSWKFEEMGDQVKDSWSMNEQKAFETFMKKKPSNAKTFWNRILKCLPSKTKKGIIDYYFNVYIPRRMSLERRVDTDDEIEEGDENLGLQRRAERRSPTTSKKAKYLRGS